CGAWSLGVSLSRARSSEGSAGPVAPLAGGRMLAARQESRLPSGRTFLLFRLGESAHHPIALEPRDVVDEQHPVQMIDFMLNAGSQQPGAVHLPFRPVAVEKADAAFGGTFDLFVVLRNGQASLLVDRAFPGGPDDLRVDEAK